MSFSEYVVIKCKKKKKTKLHTSCLWPKICKGFILGLAYTAIRNGSVHRD